jgi:hypothetical protein
MGRKIGAVVVGVLVLGLVVGVLQAIGASFRPLPEGVNPLDPADAEAFAAHLATMPAISWLFAFASELAGALLGALAAGWIAKGAARPISAIIVGLALVGSVLNWTLFAHPTWFIVGQLVGYPLVLAAAWGILGRGRSAGPNGR